MGGAHEPVCMCSRLQVDELGAIAKRLDELQGGHLAGRCTPLPEAIAEIWSSSVAAVRGSVRFLMVLHDSLDEQVDDAQQHADGSTVMSEWPVAAVTEAAKELQCTVARLGEARLRGHAALAGTTPLLIANSAEPLVVTTPEAGSAEAGSMRVCGAAGIRALCPRCRELYEWAPTYYAGVARGAVSERLAELRRRCATRAGELRQEVTLERGRLRRFVEDELGSLIAATRPTEEDCVDSKCRPLRPISTRDACNDLVAIGKPRCVIDALRRQAADLRNKRSRRLSGDRLEELRRSKTNEVMTVAETHLEQVWERSMTSWFEGALEPQLLAPPLCAAPNQQLPPESASAKKGALEVVMKEELPLWSVEQTFELGPQGSKTAFTGQVALLEMDLGGGRLDSVSMAVEHLNAGRAECLEGVCVVYSVSQGCYFCLYRRDRRRVALLKFHTQDEAHLEKHKWRTSVALDVPEAAADSSEQTAAPADAPLVSSWPNASPGPRDAASRNTTEVRGPPAAERSGMFGPGGLVTPARPTPQISETTPGSVEFRIDVLDTAVEAYAAAFAGQDVIRDYAMMGFGRVENESSAGDSRNTKLVV